jgi:flavin reductase (DIM6/NTAB) family NADH-FMN oxidoreductase RutF
VQTVRIPVEERVPSVDLVIGRVEHVHIADEMIGADGKLDVLKIRPIARMGYYDYTTVESMFEMRIPGEDQAALAGLEGRPG